MLPTLQIAPFVVKPTLLSARRNALQELKKLDAIHVVPTGKKDQFIVEVFEHQTIPIADAEEPTTQDDTRLRRSTIRIERGLLDFIHLREQVYNSAHRVQHHHPCEFCLAILDLIVFGSNPDGLLVGLLGRKRMAQKLSQFTETLLKLTLQHASTDIRGCCTAQMSIPQFVHAFYFTS